MFSEVLFNRVICSPTLLYYEHWATNKLFVSFCIGFNLFNKNPWLMGLPVSRCFFCGFFGHTCLTHLCHMNISTTTLWTGLFPVAGCLVSFMSSHLKEGGHIDFGAFQLASASALRFSVGITLSCMHNILWTSRWILTKFLWIYNWDNKELFRFGDLDPIFKVTALEKTENLRWEEICFPCKHWY